jgi:hypothetical protein
MPMAKALALGLVGALTMAVLATTAVGRATFNTEVTVTNTGPGAYSGKVNSKPFRRKCEKGRQISVYHDTNGNGTVDSTDFLIGTTTTDTNGNWSLTGEEQAPTGDRVIAVAAAKKKRKTKCKEGQGSTTAR